MVQLVCFHMSHISRTHFKKFKTRVKNKNFIPSVERILSCRADFNAAAVLIFGFGLKVEKEGKGKVQATSSCVLSAHSKNSYANVCIAASNCIRNAHIVHSAYANTHMHGKHAKYFSINMAGLSSHLSLFLRAYI